MVNLRSVDPPPTLVLLLVVAAGACDRTPGSDDPGPRPTVRDSAGVSVVTTPTGALESWVLGPEIRSVGVTTGDPEQELDQVRDPWLTRDGRLMVPEGGSRSVKTFADDGTLTGRFGGQGQGPGEFGDLTWARPYRGDSVATWDRGQRRLIVWSPEGTPVRTVELAPLPASSVSGDSGASSSADAVDVLANGSFLGVVTERAPSPLDSTFVHRPRRTYAIWSPDGAAPRLVARVPGEELLMVSHGPRDSSGPLPFGRDSHAATTTAAGAPVVILAVNDAFQLRIRSMEGQLIRLARLPLEARPVTDADRTTHIEEEEALIARLPGLLKNLRRERLDAAVYPDSMPFHGALLAAGGLIWLERYPGPGTPGSGEWVGFDADSGRAVARLQIPGGIRPTFIADGILVGVHTDELDVERVVVHEVGGDPEAP